MKRESGFYWVKITDRWEIAEWYIGWEIIGSEVIYQDSYFDEIDERRITREPETILSKEEYIENQALGNKLFGLL